MEKGLEIVASSLHPVRYDDAIPDSLYNAIKGSLKEQLNYMVLLLVDLKRNFSESKYINNELKRISKEVALFMEGNYSTNLSHSNVNEMDVRFAFEKLRDSLANEYVQRETFNEFKEKYPFVADIQAIPYEDIREQLNSYIHLKEKQICGQLSLFDNEIQEKLQIKDKDRKLTEKNTETYKQIIFNTGVVFTIKESFAPGYFHGSDLTECPFSNNDMSTPWGTIELVLTIGDETMRSRKNLLNMSDNYVFSVDYDCPMDESANYTLFFETGSYEEWRKCSDVANRTMEELGRMFSQEEMIEEISENCNAKFLLAVNETDIKEFINDIEKTNSFQHVKKGRAR